MKIEFGGPTQPVAPQADETSADPLSRIPVSVRAAFESRGFDGLTSVQSAVLEAEVEGSDLAISSQTGSGKTVALGFVLATTLEATEPGAGPTAVIIVPTRELAGQVSDELTWLLAGLRSVRVGAVTGGTPLGRDRYLLGRRPRVLVATPGRLLDHVRSGAVDLADVRELVLDEADQMLDMGFREDLEAILEATPATRRTHMVSATFPEGIRSLAARYQRTPLRIEGTRLGEANADIEHEGHLVRREDRYATLVNLLLGADGERTLVFVERRADAVEVAERLESDGFAALPLSGELAQSQRERTLAAFRAGRATVLVATDVAARGLDVPDVRMVVHTAPPIDSEVYTHRSGRTGRAGQRGRSVLLAPPRLKRRTARLVAEAGVDLTWRPVPSAAEVRTQLAGRARARLDADLTTRLEADPSPEHLAHAESLLSGRAPERVVAALLARLEPGRKARPRDVSSPATPETPRRTARPSRERPGQRARARFEREDMVRFFVNWGANQGANPSRVLAAACRRGEVTGKDIGSIAIHPNASTFDVRREVAERFERNAGRRDPRDPKTLIRRDQKQFSRPRS